MANRKPRIAAFDPSFLADLRWWIETDRKVALRIVDLIEECLRDPFVGIGKPEPLRGNLSGMWSRRITLAHRLVYSVDAHEVLFHQARFHYS